MAHPEPAPHPSRALRASMGLGLAVAMLVAGMAASAVVANAGERAPSRAEQARFMWAMATIESSRDYFARNRSSGAFGKYQIMPFNWPAWSLKYVGDADADQTPWNQERVAYGKLRDLHAWLGTWRRVAYWWLTGSSVKNERRWSGYAQGYVDAIIRLRKRAPRNGSPLPRRTSSAAGPGDWRRAGQDQMLRLAAAGKPWSDHGGLRDGQVVKVRESRSRSGLRWLRVVTADGRLGWVRQRHTVPARLPARPQRWRDADDRGREQGRSDRRMVRLRPR